MNGEELLGSNLFVHLFSLTFGPFPLTHCVKCAAVDILVRVHVGTPVSISFGCVPRSGIAGSCGNSGFNLYEELPNSGSTGCTFIFPPAVCENSSMLVIFH